MAKKIIVLSGVNMVEGGILTIYQDFIREFSKLKEYKVICLVNSKKLFDKNNNVKFLEFPKTKKSWLKRVYFEYVTSWFLSKRISPFIWICLHDMTANTTNTNFKYVYCHNPSPFYRSSIREFKLDKKFYLFTKFYKKLYSINIRKNTAVIVQQEWIADFFEKEFKLDNVYVSRPENNTFSDKKEMKDILVSEKINLIYPAIPRVFKNFDVLIEALEILKNSNIELYNSITLTLTFNKGFNKVADDIINKASASGIDNICFSGVLSKDEINNLYNKENTLLVFPSKLETWGLPLSESKEMGIPILVASLSYARETLGEYKNVNFFDPNSAEDLIEKLKLSMSGIFEGNNFIPSSKVKKNWKELTNSILNGDKNVK